MPQKENKKVKFATVRVGKVCLVILYICVSVLALTAIIMLFNDLSIGLGLCGVVLFIFVPIIVLTHFHNVGNTVTFVDDKIQSKRRTLTWDTACLTVHCHSMIGGRFPCIWLYFDDHYLTSKEVMSWKVSRQGLVLRLDNMERLEFILSRCTSKIELCGEFYTFTRAGMEIISMIESHNGHVNRVSQLTA